MENPSPPTEPEQPRARTRRSAAVPAEVVTSADASTEEIAKSPAVPPSVPPPAKPSKNLPFDGKPPVLPDGYESIVTHVFELPDPELVYSDVINGIKAVKASKCSMSELMDALDSAQSNALAARKLLVNMKLTVTAVSMDTNVLMSAMRDQASAALEREKEAGLRKKAITEADVQAQVATMFPDEWKAVQDRDAKSKQSVAFLEDLCERAVERARDLRAIVASSRSV